jgi:RimJ/RimL family protein N-acetyltransferase
MKQAGKIFLAGEQLYLRALEEADADGVYPGWLNDAATCSGNSHHVFPYTREAALAYITHSRSNRNDLVLAITLRDDDRHIGNIALQNIHPIYRSADLSILIGEHNAWGKGYGTQAARLLCDHGFQSLNLHRIACGTFSSNVSMQRMAVALGMRQEGIRRQAAFKSGSFVDVLEYAVLHHEYKEHHPQFTMLAAGEKS